MPDTPDQPIEQTYLPDQDAPARAKLRDSLQTQAHAAATKTRLADEPELSDGVITQHLADLGFTADTAPALHLIPLVEVAWADGDVSSTERFRVLRIAQAHGINPASPAGQLLAALLEEPPAAEFFTVVRQHLHDLLDARGLKPESLLELCQSIAEISGGFFGFGTTISPEESDAIADLAAHLNQPEATYVNKTNDA